MTARRGIPQVRGAEHVEHVVDRRVVGTVAVDVRVPDRLTRAEDEGRAHLGDACAGLVDAMAALPRLDRRTPGLRMEESDERRLVHRRGLRGTRVVVDQDQIRDLLVLHERRGVALVAGTDRDEVRTERLDLVVARAELGSMLAAVDAAEVAQEHEDDGLVGPEVTELVLRAGRVGQLEGIEGGEVHRVSL